MEGLTSRKVCEKFAVESIAMMIYRFAEESV